MLRCSTFVMPVALQQCHWLPAHTDICLLHPMCRSGWPAVRECHFRSECTGLLDILGPR